MLYKGGSRARVSSEQRFELTTENEEAGYDAKQLAALIRACTVCVCVLHRNFMTNNWQRVFRDANVTTAEKNQISR